MFTPKVFAEHDIHKISSFIKFHPLATVIARTEDGMEASHIPMYWQDDDTEHGCLYGHITITNPLNGKVDITSPMNLSNTLRKYIKIVTYLNAKILSRYSS